MCVVKVYNTSQGSTVSADNYVLASVTSQHFVESRYVSRLNLVDILSVGIFVCEIFPLTSAKIGEILDPAVSDTSLPEAFV